MSILKRNQFMPGKDNNYLIAGNICNAFALGELGSSEDFFLVGAEPEDESNYPLLTGNILDSEGNLLFRLVKNMLILNPGKCSKILGDHVGYEIHDGNDKFIFAIKTQFKELPELGDKFFVTTLSGNFYNKAGELVFSANSGEPDEKIETYVKSAFGFTGGFGLVQGMKEEEIDFARIVLSSRGAVHEPARGLIEGGEFQLDGKALIEAHIKNCTVFVRHGNFATYGKYSFEGCKFVFKDEAENIKRLVLAIAGQSPKKEDN